MNKPIKISFDATKLDNALFKKVGDKTYVNLVAWPNRNGADDYGNTHYIKQDLPKDAQKQDLPIIGNLKQPSARPVEKEPAQLPPNPGADHSLDDSQVPF